MPVKRFFISLTILSLFNANLVMAQNNEPFATLWREILAKAQSDECYYGLGDPRNYSPIPPSQCQQGGEWKVNQAYVWGLAKSGDRLWFGTMANTHCLVLGVFLRNFLGPHELEPWVCEYQEGVLAKSPYNLPASVADWRPPKLYVYDLQNNTLTAKIPGDLAGRQRLGATLGIRSAGTLGNVVFLAGPALSGGINVFAFNTSTGAYLGSTTLAGYNNIRRWVVVDNVLYTAVGRQDGGGSVLRWTGSLTGSPQDLFQFEVVGNVDADAAEIAYHDGRLFVGTWPSFLGGGQPSNNVVLAGLWMSPPLPQGGLTSSHADSWTKVWQVDDYEPDPVTAATYGMGAMASFDGYLYWGTMHVPFVATYAHFLVHRPSGDNVLQQAIQGTWRAISIFRGRNFTFPIKDIQLLYGEPFLPVYLPSSIQGQPGMWMNLPNNMWNFFRGMPIYGNSGFGNPYNNYTWIMSVFNEQLFVGTMDWSYLIYEFQKARPDIDLGTFPTGQYGADLFRFVSSNYAAIPESLNGLGNYANYGIRTVISEDSLYLGMANPMNLLTDPLVGGWELLRLTIQEGIFPAEGRVGTTFSIVKKITGGFSGFGKQAGTVQIGRKNARILAWGNSSIYCQVPSGLKPGTYDVKIKPRRGATITMSQKFLVKSK